MDIAALTIDAQRLWPGEALWDGPLAFVDLDKTGETPEHPALPPCPVIGIGDSSHPFATSLDAVIEPPFTAAGLASQVLAMPSADFAPAWQAAEEIARTCGLMARLAEVTAMDDGQEVRPIFKAMLGVAIEMA